jgi:hypothetical protein
LAVARLPLPANRVLLDRSADGAAATLADLVAAGEDVLAVVADVARRLPGLAERLGGFALTSWEDLEDDPAPALAAAHLVALDPPASAAQQALLTAGRGGYAHVVYGSDETAFALRVLEHECALREPVAELYRRLRVAGALAGDELEAALQAAGGERRASRAVQVLTELDLAVLEGATLRHTSAERTELERSATFREAQARLEEGRKLLSAPLRRAA